MAAPRQLALGYLSYAPLPITEAVALAGELGFKAIGTRLLPAVPGGWYEPLIEDRAARRAVQSAMHAAGVGLLDVELVRIEPGFSPDSLRPLLDVAAELGATTLLTLAGDEDESRLTTSFASLCDEAHRVGLEVALEFLPWLPAGDANSARRIVAAAGAANGRVLVDPLHVARSTTTIEDLVSLPPAMLSYLQLCDAPAEPPADLEGLLHAARSERLAPGEGGLDLADMIVALPQGLPVSLEIPNVARVAEFGPRDWIRHCRDAAIAVIAEADGRRAAGLSAPQTRRTP